MIFSINIPVIGKLVHMYLYPKLDYRYLNTSCVVFKLSYLFFK